MTFDALLVLISLTYGYLLCIWHLRVLDKIEARKRRKAAGIEVIDAEPQSTILNYDYV